MRKPFFVLGENNVSIRTVINSRFYL
jgi:hypothetical protein